MDSYQKIQLKKDYQSTCMILHFTCLALLQVEEAKQGKQIKINKNKIDEEKKKFHPQNKEYEENKWERKFDPVDNQQKMASVQ